MNGLTYLYFPGPNHTPPPPDIWLPYEPPRDSARWAGRPPAAVLTGGVVVPPIPGTQGELGEGSIGWEGVTDQALQ